MANRQRNIRIQFRVTEQEKKLIEQKMKELGTKNTEAYLRKMAIDGLIIHLDTTDVRELVRLLRVTSNSLNQLTKRGHETGSIYGADIEDLRQSYDRLWSAAEEIMLRLAAI
ncbi:plasmid mobilization protein [Clostridium cadaveris]|uniref:plasmid mobilization protein n=1 Tax=Clostridium cadaveris TaxID=1529 RepID=UPI0015B521F5|nr:plasmid mobilization relaxosome protein MobC [Clostridium cadaveris]NWK10798.1 plasmid mobilization relaxosome protein MobC [Clostridium cadaveris]